MPKRKVIWTKQAVRQLNAAITYIRKDSAQNADTIKDQILKKINALSDDKVVHRKDPCKINNDGSYLYFEVMKYRIAYYTEPNTVFIIRIRHTGMEPRLY